MDLAHFVKKEKRKNNKQKSRKSHSGKTLQVLMKRARQSPVENLTSLPRRGCEVRAGGRPHRWPNPNTCCVNSRWELYLPTYQEKKRPRPMPTTNCGARARARSEAPPLGAWASDVMSRLNLLLCGAEALGGPCRRPGGFSDPPYVVQMLF